MPNKLIIKEPSSFYSYLDEENFFRWLQSIPVVTDVVRVGFDLEISLDSPIDEPNLRDLIAVLKRYGVDLKCLRKFVDSSNESWFKNPQAYWYKAVFEE
jgi:hypothetical protein